jgi:hypothetical protein
MRFDFRDSFSYRDAVSAVGHLSYECCQAAFQAFIGLVLSLRCEGAAFLWVALRAVFVPDPPPRWGNTRRNVSQGGGGGSAASAGADERTDNDANWKRLPGLGVLSLQAEPH